MAAHVTGWDFSESPDLREALIDALAQALADEIDRLETEAASRGAH